MRPTTFAILALASAAAALLGVALRATADEGTKASGNALVNKPGVVDAHNSPSLARDPRSADTVVATHRIDRPTFSAVLN